MKYLDSTNKNDSLYHHSLYLLGKQVTDTTSIPVSDFVRSSQIYCRKAGYLIWQNASGWEFNDLNYVSSTNNLPFAVKDLSNGTQDYTIPTNVLDVQRVEVKDSNGNYTVLNRMTKEEIEDIALTEYYKNNGLPKYWQLRGNYVSLYPAPASGSVTTSSGLKLYIDRDVTTPTMTTSNGAYRTINESPGFHIMFHPYISYGCAIDYGVRSNYPTDKMNQLRMAFLETEKNMSNYYARRDRDYPTKVRPTVRGSI